MRGSLPPQLALWVTAALGKPQDGAGRRLQQSVSACRSGCYSDGCQCPGVKRHGRPGQAGPHVQGRGSVAHCGGHRHLPAGEKSSVQACLQAIVRPLSGAAAQLHIVPKTVPRRVEDLPEYAVCLSCKTLALHVETSKALPAVVRCCCHWHSVAAAVDAWTDSLARRHCFTCPSA